MTDIRKYYDEDFGTFVMYPEAKLMQARSKPVEEEGIAKAGQLFFQGEALESLEGTFVQHSKSRIYWPQGQSSPLCESDDGANGRLKDPEMEDVPFGGDCAKCPMLTAGCQARQVVMFEAEGGEKFFVQAHGRSVNPTITMVQAAKLRAEGDPMKVEIGSTKGGKHNTYAFSFRAL